MKHLGRHPETGEVIDDAPAIDELAITALKLYTPPFKYNNGYIWDSKSNMVADDKGQDVALRVRGWGLISYKPNPEALQDKMGELIAQALTDYWLTHQGG